MIVPGGAARKLDEAGLYEYAVRALGGRAHSIGELKEKLRRRAGRADDVERVVARLKEHGYLDDRRFAESFAAARLENHRLGRTRVLRDLRQRRVAPALAERTVGQLYRQVDEAALIDEWIRRRLRAAPRDQKELASAYRRLLRAGFGSGEILRALKKLAAHPELLEGFEPPDQDGEES